ncbi:oligosaccharide flippase family protein [Chthonobacter albigriseus]|uniref:oligosaccharide flippase family protein n=1 Tax=Chthonobacter albigriseus TaxID=1683161 RepID=UPI0015EED13E
MRTGAALEVFVPRDPQDQYGSSAATRQAVIQGGFITTLGQVAKVVLTLGTQVLLARLLMPEDFGIIAMVAPVLGFLQVMAELGVPQIIVQSPSLRYGDLESLFWRNMRLALILAVAALALSPLVAMLYSEPRVLPVMMAMASLIPLQAASAPLSALLSREMRYGVQAMVEIAALLLNGVVTVAAALAGLEYWALFCGQLASSVATLTIFLLVSRWRPSHPRRGLDVSHMVRAGSNITTANMAGFLNVTLDNVLIGTVLGETSLGLYDRAWKFAVQPLQMIIMPIGRVALPTLSRLHIEKTRYRNAVRQFLEILLIISTPAMVFGATMADPLIDFVLGPNWEDLAPVFAFVCFGATVSPVNAMIFWLFISQGRTEEQKRWAIITSVINVSTYVCGLPFGLVGVACFSATSNWIIQAPLLFRTVSAAGPVNWRDLMTTITPFLVAAGVEAAFLLAAGHLRHVSGFLDLAAHTVLAYLVFFGTVMLFPTGRASLLNLLSVVTERIRKPAAA